MVAVTLLHEGRQMDQSAVLESIGKHLDSLSRRLAGHPAWHLLSDGQD